MFCYTNIISIGSTKHSVMGNSLLLRLNVYNLSDFGFILMKYASNLRSPVS